MEAAFQSGFASASLQVLLEKFATFALNEIGLIWGVDGELDKLERTMFKIQALLDDMEPYNVVNKALQVWIQDLHRLFYEADDLLDDVSMELLKLDPNESIRSRHKNQVREQVLSSFKFSLPHEINKLQKKLEDIVSEMDSPLMARKISQCKVIRRPTSSLVDESSVIGREDDKEKIVQMLADFSIFVIPIVGIGGIGKTSLAQIVFNDLSVVQLFDMRIWVSVSLEFDKVDITKTVLESVTGKVCKFSDFDLMQTRLRKLLRSKRFLLVLDGMWDNNSIDWDILKLPFLAGAKGSKILVTTRSVVVSQIVVTSHIHFLEPLSDEDCWTVIKRKAFLNKTSVEREVLEVVGKEIAKKCKGNPLVAKTLGGVLFFKSKDVQWNVVSNSELWDLDEEKHEIFPVLKLSYDQLPVVLKRCFVYCSKFPLNHGFEKDELIQMWIAEGFVQPRCTQRIEDVGAEYFDDLLWRSFFYHSHINQHGQTIYKMHDLIHTLAQLVSAYTMISLENDMSSLLHLFQGVPHFSLVCQPKQPAMKILNKHKFLRSVMLSKYGSRITHFPYEFPLHLQSLRVLDLSCTAITELPVSIECLRHLRFLNVSKTNISELPESITNLYWLQTIKLRNCQRFLCLPTYTKKLTKLRHLELDIRTQLNQMPPEFGKLTNLQGLDAFIVGKERGHRIDELMNMRDLRGSICITNLENVASRDEAKKAGLKHKLYLEKLELEWKSAYNLNVEQEVLAAMQPHSKIKELHIIGYGGIMFPSWLGSPLFCKLECITLNNCHNCRLFPVLGCLPKLKSLDIHKMYNLELWDHNLSRMDLSVQFPSLEFLKLHDLPKLQRWEGLHSIDMPKLHKLTIEYCPSLLALPSLHHRTSLATLCISRCFQLQSLPHEGLPHSLRSLIISECNILKQRCRVDGEDWNKIKLIPHVEIDYVEISMQSVVLRQC